MKVIKAQNVYSYILTEDEWYAGTEQQQEAWRVEVKRKAHEEGCRYMAILVDPDPIMSMAPIARRHAVWRNTMPTTDEEDFRNSLTAVLDLHHDKLSAPRMRAICKEVFGE